MSELSRRAVLAGLAAPAQRQEISGDTFSSQSAGRTYSLQTDSLRDVYRFEVRNGDHWAGDRGRTCERSELCGARTWPFRTPVWVAYSFMVEDGPPLTSQWCVIGQFHATPDTGDINTSPPLSLELGSDDQCLLIVTRSSNRERQIVNPPPVVRFRDAPIERGRWYDIVARVTFDPVDGDLLIWRDGAQVLNAPGIPTAYRDTLGPYWKFGIYRDRPLAPNENLALRYAHMELSSKSLEHRVIKPARLDSPL